MRGLLVEVIEDSRGSQATAVAVVGGSQIHVEDLTPFPETGGIVDVLGEQYAYTSVIPDPEAIDPDTLDPTTSGSIVLGDLITVQVDVDDPVRLVLGGAPATDAYAVVEFPAPTDTDQPDDIAPVHVPIDYSQRPMFTPGPYDPAVPIEVSDDLTRVITVPGVKPTIDGSTIINLPDPTEPTTAPASSPTPEPVGNIRVILGRHASVLLASDYDIYLSDTNASAPDAAHLATTTGSTLWQVTQVPDVMAIVNPDSSLDKSLQPNVTYYVAIVARNLIGSAAPSAWVPVSLRLVTDEDISAAFAYLGRVNADQIDAGTLAAAITLTGILKTRQTETEPGGEMDTASLRGYAAPDTVGEPAPLQVEIAFDGRPSYFAGDIAAAKFDAYQGADLHGDANNVKADGGITLEAGSSSGSSAAPSVTQGISSVALTRPSQTAAWGSSVTFDAAACQSFNWDVPSGKWIASQNVSGKGVANWRIGTDGTVTALGTDDGWYHYGWMRDPVPANNTFYVLTAQVGNPSNLWLSGFKLGSSSSLQIPRLNTAGAPVATWSSVGNLRVAERVGSTIVTRVYSISGANPVLSATQTSDAWWPSENSLGSINVTQGPAFAAAQSVYCPRLKVARIRVANTGVTELPDYEWDTPVSVVGICPDGPDTASSGGFWYGLGTDNRLYKFTNSTWTGSFTKRTVVGTTSTTSTAETQVGSKVVVQWKRRHQMTITAPPLVDPAIRAGVYAVQWASGTPTDSQMFRHGYTATGGRTLTIDTVLTSGSAPGTAPTADPYPIASPAWIRSEATDSDGAIVDLVGNGTDGRLWNLRPDVGMLYRATSSSTASLTNATITHLTGSWTPSHAVGVGAGAYFSAYSAGTWTIGSPGLYDLNFTANVAAGGGRRMVLIYVNGSEVRRAAWAGSTAGVSTPQVCHKVNLAAGDTVTFHVYQDSGGSLSLSSGHEVQFVKLAG